MGTIKKMFRFDFNEKVTGSVHTEFSAIADSKKRAIELFEENTDADVNNYNVDEIRVAKDQLGRYYPESFEENL